MISTMIVKDTQGNAAVGVILGLADVFLTVEGVPTPGVALNLAGARELARRLLEAADQLENKPGGATSLGVDPLKNVQDKQILALDVNTQALPEPRRKRAR